MPPPRWPPVVACVWLPEAGRIRSDQPIAVFEEPDEHVLARIHRFVFVREQTPAPSQDHRAVLATEGVDVQRISHAAAVTPGGGGSVTGDRVEDVRFHKELEDARKQEVRR